MKSIRIIVLLVLFGITPHIAAQHYIGLAKDAAKSLARTNGFFPDDMTTNQSFNYLKFVNSAGTKTLLVYFNDQNQSTHSKMVCDFSEFDYVIKELNGKYKKAGDKSWEYTHNSEVFSVVLEEEEWYFTVRTKKK